MIHVISKSTFGDYNVRDIQCNANWCSCPYSDYALIPDSMVEEILATCGYCDITLNEEGTEVVSFVARENPNAPIEIVCPALVETKEEFDGVIGAELDGMPVGGVKTIYVKDPNNAVGVGATCYTVTMHKNAHNPFPTFYEHCCMADIEIHGYGEYKAWGVKPYNGDGAGEKWSISDPQLVLVEEHMADRVTAKGATDDGWTWEKWRSGKFEAWRDFNESVGGAIDLGSGNFYRYQYRYEFALPFESKTTPHVFVTLRSSGENLLVGVTPERGSKWWTVDSFDESLQEFGTDFQSVQEAFESEGVTYSEFVTALDDCNGDAAYFLMDMMVYSNPDADGSETVNEVMASIPLTDAQLQQAFDNTEPSPGSVTQAFTVLSAFDESEHTINADIHVIGTWDGGHGGNAATVSVDKTNNGHQVTITDSNASYVFDVIDGISATHEWDGTVLTVTSASGTSSADLKGEKGDPGAGTAPVAAIKENILVVESGVGVGPTATIKDNILIIE